MFLALAVCATPGARMDAVAAEGDGTSVADDVRLEAESWWPEAPPDDAWRPVAVLLLPTGGMIVADQAQGRLFQLGSPRLGLDRLPSPDPPVVEWTALAPAVGLSFFALDGPGRIVHQYDYSGNYLGVAANLDAIAHAEGLGPVDPAGIAVDRAGQILVSDRMSDRILVFDASWNLTCPRDTEVDCGSLAEQTCLGDFGQRLVVGHHGQIACTGDAILAVCESVERSDGTRNISIEVNVDRDSTSFPKFAFELDARVRNSDDSVESCNITIIDALRKIGRLIMQ